jgi:predicted nucleotidyltransferase
MESQPTAVRNDHAPKTDSQRFGVDLAAVRAFLARKESRRQAELDRRFAQASSDFRNIVDAIVSRHRPLRIWQWGSLLDRRRFSEISDIDIALEGLPGPEAFFDVLGLATERTSFPVDIVEIEKVGCENAEYIRTRGKIVYERPEER